MGSQLAWWERSSIGQQRKERGGKGEGREKGRGGGGVCERAGIAGLSQDSQEILPVLAPSFIATSSLWPPSDRTTEEGGMRLYRRKRDERGGKN